MRLSVLEGRHFMWDIRSLQIQTKWLKPLNINSVYRPDQAGHLRFKQAQPKMSGVRCQVSGVVYYLSPLNCHMSLMPTATAPDPPTARPSLCRAECCCCSWPRYINNELQRPQKQKKLHGDYWPFLSKNGKFWDQCPINGNNKTFKIKNKTQKVARHRNL